MLNFSVRTIARNETSMLRFVLLLFFEWMAIACCSAQVVPYAGILGGLATLSADARSQLTAQGLNASLYKPGNGPALNLFGGAHVTQYLSLQANYIWNRNDLILSSTSSASNTFYEEQRKSSQHALIFDLLIYFRRQDSRLRPYLSAGTGIAHLSSTQQRIVALSGTPTLPASHFSSTRPVLRVAVGMDIAIAHHLAFRYSFSETLRHNDISCQLSPPGQRGLANFQNLFGIGFRF
jgi:outer membrane protein with beta-barrel domain